MPNRARHVPVDHAILQRSRSSNWQHQMAASFHDTTRGSIHSFERSARGAALALAAILSVGGCSGDSPTASAASLQILVFTGGEYADTDGYTIRVSGDSTRQVRSDATVVLPSLASGTYSISISGIGSNCTLRGPASIDVELVGGETTTTRFEIDCHRQPDVCQFELDLATSGGVTPDFTWNPMCRLVSLSVVDLDWSGDEPIRWVVQGPPFLSPVRYGVTPPGATVLYPPLPLTSGHRILVGVQYFTFFGGLDSRSLLFTP